MPTHINSLVLDSGPLITQTYSELHSKSEKFFTTPSVYNEIRDERSRQNLLLWGDQLVIRQPKAHSVSVVSEFAKKTGDYSVLSSTDIQILALCYEIEVELNKGDWRLRKYPGERKGEKGKEDVKEVEEAKEVEAVEPAPQSASVEAVEPETSETTDDGWSVVTSKPRKTKKNKKINDSWSKPGKEKPKHLPETAAAELTTSEQPESAAELSTNEQPESSTAFEADNIEEVIEEDDENDNDDWITTENLQVTLEKDQGETNVEAATDVNMQAAVSTGDFAMQNVALQMGLNLVNPTNGKQIKRVKNYMLRCHACFKLTGFPKDGTPRQFCPRCGGATLLRCTVQVSTSGTIRVFLKKNMQWSNRGNRYTLPNPQGRRARKLRHEEDPVLLREDQKEYQKAVKDSMWKKRHNEKLLDEWIGTGSADSVASPFAISGYKRDATKHTGVQIGRGRYVNSARRKK